MSFRKSLRFVEADSEAKILLCADLQHDSIPPTIMKNVRTPDFVWFSIKTGVRRKALSLILQENLARVGLQNVLKSWLNFMSIG